MMSGTFDLQTTLLVVGAALAVVILLWLLLRAGRRRQSLQRDEAEMLEKQSAEPYAVTKERPYMKAAPPPPPAPAAPPAPAPAPPAPAPIATSPPDAAPPPAAEPPLAPPPEDRSADNSPTAPDQPPPPPSPAAVTTGRPEPDDEVDVSQPAVPLPGDLVGIAFPPRSTDHADALTRLKGVGPKLEAMLNEHGITRYEQLASLDEAELAALDARLGNFKGRLARDRVVEQARLLASGDTQAFEAKFGKLGG